MENSKEHDSITRHLKQRLNNTTKGETNRLEKDPNRLDKLKIRQLEKTQQNWNGSFSSKGILMG